MRRAAGLLAVVAAAAVVVPPPAPAAGPASTGTKAIDFPVTWAGPGLRKRYPVTFSPLPAERATPAVTLSRGALRADVPAAPARATWACANGERAQVWYQLARSATRLRVGVVLQGPCAARERADASVSATW